MKYSELVGVYDALVATQSKLKKAEIIAAFLKEVPEKEIEKVALLLQGRVYHFTAPEELGVAQQQVIRAIAKATGYTQDDVVKSFTKTGDLGITTEDLLKKKKQSSLGRGTLTIDKVFEELRSLAVTTGTRSQERKQEIIAGLLTAARNEEARYVIRTILQDLRVGVAEGIIKDAIVAAFLETEDKDKKTEAQEAVDFAASILSDLGEVAAIAKEKGVKGLRSVEPELGKPIQVMLGLAAEKIEDVTKEFGSVYAQYKYDGMRVQIHKKNDRVQVFTRRLEDVTKQFPDIVDACKKGLRSRECIVEGEALAINPKSGRPMPFQELSQRIHRKYDIEKLAEQVPIELDFFDITYLDGELLVDKPLAERWETLGKIVKESKGFRRAKQLLSDNPEKLDAFYQEALKAGQEGIFLKVPSSKYVFGRYVNGWYKIKPIMETLDLVIVGATWGEGKRAKWLSSYALACRDGDEFRTCGMLSTGLTDEQYKEMTETLKPLITKEEGRTVYIKPTVVIEAGYQEIQKSPKYASGYALRFPRLIRIRDDKGPNDADSIKRVENLYKTGGKKG